MLLLRAGTVAAFCVACALLRADLVFAFVISCVSLLFAGPGQFLLCIHPSESLLSISDILADPSIPGNTRQHLVVPLL